MDEQVKNLDKEKGVTIDFDVWRLEWLEKDYKRAMKEENFEAAQRIENKIKKIRERKKRKREE